MDRLDIHTWIYPCVDIIHGYCAVAFANETKYLSVLSLHFSVCRSYSSFARLFMLLSQMNNQ